MVRWHPQLKPAAAASPDAACALATERGCKQPGHRLPAHLAPPALYSAPGWWPRPSSTRTSQGPVAHCSSGTAIACSTMPLPKPAAAAAGRVLPAAWPLPSNTRAPKSGTTRNPPTPHTARHLGTASCWEVALQAAAATAHPHHTRTFTRHGAVATAAPVGSTTCPAWASTFPRARSSPLRHNILCTPEGCAAR